MIIYHNADGNITGYQLFPDSPPENAANFITVETPETETEISELVIKNKVANGKLVKKSDAHIAKEKKEQDLKAIQIKRGSLYPSIQDQLDLIYWDKVNGTNIWVETIDAVKAKHPKPGAV